MHHALNRRQTLLAAMLPVAALSLLNVFYKEPLYRLGVGWYWAADVVQFVLAPLACAWFLLRPAGIGLEALGLRSAWYERRVSTGTMLVYAVVMVALSWPVFELASRFQTASVSLPDLMPPAGIRRALLAFYMAASAAVVEEVVFRALPWLYLRDLPKLRARVPLYLLASTVVFALCHSEQGIAGMMAAAWFGLLAAAYYLKLRSLRAPILAHFTLDALAFF